MILKEDKVELAQAGGQDEVEESERSEAHLRRYAGSQVEGDPLRRQSNKIMHKGNNIYYLIHI